MNMATKPRGIDLSTAQKDVEVVQDLLMRLDGASTTEAITTFGKHTASPAMLLAYVEALLGRMAAEVEVQRMRCFGLPGD